MLSSTSLFVGSDAKFPLVGLREMNCAALSVAWTNILPPLLFFPWTPLFHPPYGRRLRLFFSPVLGAALRRLDFLFPSFFRTPLHKATADPPLLRALAGDPFFFYANGSGTHFVPFLLSPPLAVRPALSLKNDSSLPFQERAKSHAPESAGMPIFLLTPPLPLPVLPGPPRMEIDPGSLFFYVYAQEIFFPF